MRYFYLSAFFAFLLPALTCHAEVSEYDIEVVIFEDISTRYANSEQWPRLEHQILSEQHETTVGVNAGDIKKTADPEANDVIIISSSDTGMLNKYTKTIQASARYNVLVHKAWRQAGLDAASAINIPVSSNDSSTTSTPAAVNGLDASPAINSDPRSSISGEIKIILGRYLHIYTDLIYKRPNTSFSQSLTPVQSDQLKEYSIKSHRRMRSKELHYIDHPLVGILVMALPVEKEEVKVQEQPEQ